MEFFMVSKRIIKFLTNGERLSKKSKNKSTISALYGVDFGFGDFMVNRRVKHALKSILSDCCNGMPNKGNIPYIQMAISSDLKVKIDYFIPKERSMLIQDVDPIFYRIYRKSHRKTVLS
jgi:hypothetical protein